MGLIAENLDKSLNAALKAVKIPEAYSALLSARAGDRFKVSYAGGNLDITYTRKSEFFRGLKIFVQKMNDGLGDFSVEEQCAFTDMGLMVDCSRNAVLKPDKVKKLIRDMAMLGYNQLQLYTEDTYEVKGEPYFGHNRGRYSVGELQDLDAYAAAFGIELVPCVQCLAHLNAIFDWSVYESANDCVDILLVDEPKTYELIDNIFATLSKSFVSRKVNIGMDEAHALGLGKYLSKYGFKDRFEIMTTHLRRVMDIAAKYGFKPMMWSDMFFRLVFGGNYYEDGEVPADKLALVPTDVDLVYWDYYTEDEKKYSEMINKHNKFNNEVWFAGGIWTWTGFAPNTVNAVERTVKAYKSCIDNGIKKVFLTAWGDNGGECAVFEAMPAIVYGAEYAYGNTGIKAVKSAFKAVMNSDYDEFMSLTLLNAVDEIGGVVNPSKYMLYNDLFIGKFDSTVEGRESEWYGLYLKKLKKAEKNNPEFSFFTHNRILCEVLALKFDLGLLTRKAYLDNDLEGLARLIEKRYKPLLKKVWSFYEAFKAYWFEYNKPFGFEVQDMRLGGLYFRIRHCLERLEDYVLGRVDKIDELESPPLDFEGKGEAMSKKALCFNNWAKSITNSVI